ncbi:PEGA domain-containing protein [Bacteroidota bacterium]
MRKLILSLIILFTVTSLLMVSCSNEDNPVTNPGAMKGILFIESSPSGAEIWLQGVNTSQFTPDSLIDLTPGSYIVTLKFQNHNDTTFVVDIEEGKLTSVIVTLMSEPGGIYLSSSPPNAEILLDGVNTSQFTPDTLIDLIPGSYLVTLKLQNYRDTTFVVSVSEGQITSMIVTLMSNQGSIFIASSPSGADIWLQGVNTSQFTPDTLIDLTPGSFLITLKLQNYRDTTFVVSVSEGQTTSIIVTLIINQGNIFITSNPAGAQIWLDGVNTSQVTPDTIKNLDEGLYNVTLKLTDYYDATFSVNVTGGQTSNPTNVVLVSNLMTTLFGPVKIYETEGTTAQQPSGLDLSSGIAYDLSSAQNNLVDIYYSTDGTGGQGFLILSADLHPSLIRETDFFVQTDSTNIFDGLDSPDNNSGTWTNNIDNDETNYVFLYDYDGHYSKLKIVSRGGGVAGEPFWVQVQWYYNNTVLDNRF